MCRKRSLPNQQQHVLFYIDSLKMQYDKSERLAEETYYYWIFFFFFIESFSYPYFMQRLQQLQKVMAGQQPHYPVVFPERAGQKKYAIWFENSSELPRLLRGTVRTWIWPVYNSFKSVVVHVIQPCTLRTYVYIHIYILGIWIMYMWIQNYTAVLY